MIFDVTKENVDEVAAAYSLVPKFQEIEILKLFHFVLSVRPLSKDALATLWQRILPDYDPDYNSNFIYYLREKKIIKTTKKSFSKSVFYQDRFFDESTIENAILQDDVNAVSKFVAEENYSEEVNILLTHGTLIDVAAYCGSANVFKYLKLNKFEISNKTAEFALMGGNVEIIEMLEDSIDFEEALHYIIRYHHNHLLDWVFDNYHPSKAEIIDIAADCYNTGAVEFAVKNFGASDIDETRFNLWCRTYFINYKQAQK